MGTRGKLSAFGSGTRLLSGSISPRNPIITSSSVRTAGSRAINACGCRCLNSQVDEAPRNQNVAVSAALGRLKPPSTASCSTDQSVVRLSARPQSCPSQDGVSPWSKASVSTSFSVHFTAQAFRASVRAARRFTSALRSSPSIFEKSFLKFFFCSRTCLLHSRSTSCCICLAAACPGSTVSMSFSVSRHSSSRCIALCALAFL
mmetsp:Transcript_102202/g.288714  ORF Transcript_102202/g.288714 Transcript_102202/m.288714 type:complete len:203 (-) Transcript_102202:473-1081(-)